MGDDAPTLVTGALEAVLLPGRGTRGGYSLVVNGTTQSHVNPDDPADLQLPYARDVAAVVDARFAPGRPIRALHLGGGALTIPRFVGHSRPGSAQRIVELHGELLAFVLERLPLRAGTEVEFVIGDARRHVDEGAGPEGAGFDLAVVDVYSANVAPRSVSTVEFFRALRRAMAADGTIVVNAFAAHGLELAQNTAGILTALFAHGIALGPAEVLAGERVGNVVLAASDRPFDPELVDRSAVEHESGSILVSGSELARFAAAGSMPHDEPGG